MKDGLRLLLRYSGVALLMGVGACGLPIEQVVFARDIQAAEQAAREYYRHVAAGRFEEAFVQVGYWDEYSNVPPRLPFDAAREQWVGRVSRAKELGTFVARVERIEVFLDDGYPVGTAEVVVVTAGRELRTTQRIHFGKLGGWKMQGIRSAAEGLAELGAALGGDLRLERGGGG